MFKKICVNNFVGKTDTERKREGMFKVLLKKKEYKDDKLYIFAERQFNLMRLG